MRSDERGSVLVILAVGVPTFILLAALVLEFGSWFSHKRALQNRVDAAAYAAGVAYGFRFPQCVGNPSLATQIADEAKQYAGVAPSTYNNTANDLTPTVTVNPDGKNPCQQHTPLPPGEYTSPDGTIWTDVQVKQTVPSLFGGFGIVPSITANARVAVMQLQSMTRFRPLAIANPDYTTGECAWAIFENTANGTVTVPLTLQSDGHWHATRDIHVGSNDIHVNARLGDCTNASEQITYDDVSYIGQFDQGSPPQPQFQGIFFTPLSGDCDGPSTRLYISRRSPGCSFLVTVFIGHRSNDEIRRVTADINGSVTLTGPRQGDTFQGTVPASQLRAGSGAGNAGGTIPVTLEADYDHQRPDPPGGVDRRHIEFGTVQQFMAGDDRHEGSITAFTLSQIEINKNNTINDEQIDLVLEPLSGPTTLLRAQDGSDHTLNGVVDCADSQTFAQRIRNGCKSIFQVHPQSVCSGTLPSPPDCIQGTGTPGGATGAYNSLWAPGGSCSNQQNRNHWSNYPNIPRGDPRLITVPVTRIGAPFSSSSQHPVISFAALYVTGWRGMPGGCGNETLPAATADATADLGGEVWGHFIRFVEPSGVGAPKNSGTPANDRCDPNSTDIAACIATLVQ